MSKDNELDEILESIKQHNDQKKNFSNQDMPLEPPKPSFQNIANHSDPEVNAPEPVWNTAPDKKSKDKSKSKRALKSKPKKEKPDNVKAENGYGFNLKIAILVAVSILAAIAINQVIVYAQTGYLRPYEEKYNIEYPRGIKEEFCDAYGEDQSVIGKLIFPDLDEDVFISSVSGFRRCSTEYGTDFNTPQQFRAIRLTKLKADIESVYATADSFKKASQKVEYRDIYGNSKSYQIFASYYVTTNAKDDNGYLFPYNLYGDLVEKDFDSFKDRIGTRSLFKTGYNMSYFGKYLTISADSDFMENFRFVIVCVEVDGEVKPIKRTTPNKKIHYPQIWYDKHDKHNPYWLASGWYPEVYVDAEHTKTEKLELK